MKSFSLFIHNKDLQFYFYLQNYKKALLSVGNRTYHLKPSYKLIYMIQTLNGYDFKTAAGFTPTNSTIYQITYDRFYGTYQNHFPYKYIIDEILNLRHL